MIRNIVWFMALSLLLLIQSGVLLPFHIAPAHLIMIVIALATILSEFRQGLIITLLGGLLLDFVSGSPDGVITMSLLIVFLVLHVVLREFLSREPNKYILAATIAGGTLIYYLAYIAINRLFMWIHLADKTDVRYLFSVQLPLAIMWNLIFAYPIFKFYILTQSLASKVRQDEESIEV
ncbi:MAG: rod shape-determining protein MreD [Candidatus Doudnabacteria bacterium]|nr:rod shape-determining protein MreD [Candidatus Doudnabacteria bacterium]